jgi:hypothetical protein
MEFNDFESQIREDKQLSGFVQDVLKHIPSTKTKEKSDRMIVVSGLDALFVMAAYALFRWAKDYLDYKRATNEINTAKYQEQLIAKLIEDGFAPKESAIVTKSLLDNISKRANENDPALQKALSMIKK